jgi:hypothetical protein
MTSRGVLCEGHAEAVYRAARTPTWDERHVLCAARRATRGTAASLGDHAENGRHLEMVYVIFASSTSSELHQHGGICTAGVSKHG